MRRILKFIAVFLLAAMPGLLIARAELETRLDPVVEYPATITKVERITPFKVKIWGKSRKLYDSDRCVFKAVDWFVGERAGRAVGVPVEFLERNKTRDHGHFDFGPWIISLSENYSLQDTYANARHQCRIFGLDWPWITTSWFY